MQKLFCLIVLTISASAQAQTQQWAFNWNGQGDYSVRYMCSAIDASGNVYVGGSTVNIGTNRDFLIQKFSNSGTEIWRREFNDVGNGPDEVLAIVVDASSNVYVTGIGKSENAGNDYLTQKYDASGALLWSQIYNSTFNQYDQANSIAVDNAGNVIVTGQSDEDPTGITNDDYLTVKYNSSGVYQWEKRFNGIGDATDRAVKVVIDASDNIYVTGRSNNGIDDDYATIKYSPGGNQQWIKYGDRTHNDRASAMTIDNAGNIYVTGKSGNGNNYDYYTIKYSSGGSMLWDVAYDYIETDAATAIVLDNSGNVYVTGQSDGDATAFINYDFRTVKYDASGNQQWVKAFDGAGGNDDIPAAIFVTASNNIVVVGSSDRDLTPVVNNDFAFVSYNPSGTQNGAATFNGVANNSDDCYTGIVDANGNIFLAGSTEDGSVQRNAALVKFSSSGSQLYANIFNGEGDNSDNIRDIKTDASDNTYAAGYTVQQGMDRVMCLMKIDATGVLQWMRYVEGSSPDSDDEANAVAIDNSGNIIISGFTKNSGTSGDFTLVKYNSNGDSLWIRYYDSPAHENDKAYDMQVDASRNIYITGRIDTDPSINSNDDANTIKYDQNGNQLWIKTYNGSGNGADRGSFIRVAPSGNVYVGGRTFNGTDLDILLIKYNNSGTQQWVKKFDGTFGNDIPTAMEIDGNENIYLTGSSAGSASDTADYITLKYSSSGSLLWNNRFDNAGGGDAAQSIAILNDGTCVVTGYSDADASAAINLDRVNIAYDSNGTQSWINLNPSSKDDIGDDVLVNLAQDIFFAGHTDNSTTADINFDLSINAYDSLNAAAYWNTSYNSISDSFDVPNVQWFADNSLFVGGSSWKTNEQRNALLIRYNGFVGVQNVLSVNSDFTVQNPFENSLLIHSNKNFGKEFLFQLKDETGRTLMNSSFTTNGNNSVSLPSLSDGIYFLTITGNNSFQSFKLLHSNH